MRFGARLRFAAEVVATWTAVSVSLRTRGASELLEAVQGNALLRPGRERARPEEVALRVERVLRAMGVRNCLRRALVTARIAARRGLEVDVRLGAKIEGGRLSAHAWLEHEGRLLVAHSSGDYLALLPHCAARAGGAAPGRV